MTSWHSWAWVLGAACVGCVLWYTALPWIVRPMFRVLLCLRYGFRLIGQERVPKQGPLIFAANHVTWIDGFLFAAVSPRNGKALVNSSYLSNPLLKSIAVRAGNIPVPNSGPRALQKAIAEVQATLDRGEAVLIFPEAQLSRTGFLGTFYRGIETILSGREHVPVVPVYLGGLWCSIFSFSGGKTLLKWPSGLRRQVIVAFGGPLAPPVTVFAVRQAVQEASVFAAQCSRPRPLETINPALPKLEHPELGLLTASADDYDRPGIHQTGHKPGTLGQAPPGVALRVVDGSGTVLSCDTAGHLQAMIASNEGWQETGLRGRLDGDGFFHLSDSP
jgi:1-acyl-sn-glycerol-3-phosphate acyltransferase